MKQKKLMLLGGIRYLLPVIEAAHKLGGLSLRWTARLILS